MSEEDRKFEELAFTSSQHSCGMIHATRKNFGLMLATYKQQKRTEPIGNSDH